MSKHYLITFSSQDYSSGVFFLNDLTTLDPADWLIKRRAHRSTVLNHCPWRGPGPRAAPYISAFAPPPVETLIHFVEISHDQYEALLPLIGDSTGLQESSPDQRTDTDNESVTDPGHAQTLINLVTEGIFCEPCPLPWTCSRIEDFRGPGTEHVWQLISADGNALEYLPANVDGPSFVAWVNSSGNR